MQAAENIIIAIKSIIKNVFIWILTTNRLAAEQFRSFSLGCDFTTGQVLVLLKLLEKPNDKSLR